MLQHLVARTGSSKLKVFCEQTSRTKVECLATASKLLDRGCPRIHTRLERKDNHFPDFSRFHPRLAIGLQTREGSEGDLFLPSIHGDPAQIPPNLDPPDVNFHQHTATAAIEERNLLVCRGGHEGPLHAPPPRRASVRYPKLPRKKHSPQPSVHPPVFWQFGLPAQLDQARSDGENRGWEAVRPEGPFTTKSIGDRGRESLPAHAVDRHEPRASVESQCKHLTTRQPEMAHQLALALQKLLQPRPPPALDSSSKQHQPARHACVLFL
mmetsp:Transcript_59113/g.157034  ORF Transcript_59113/g.157034 Transcript_59113/m.157034 type:complete len:267 (+) Transcript_59113:1436-2236(+)